MNKPPAPLCRYCLVRPAGSREHLPGSAALNDSPVLVRYTVADRDSGSTKPVARVEKDGFVVRTICGKCNSRTGGNYGTAFKDFALQWRSSTMSSADVDRSWASLRHIQPLRVLKQMMGMFLAAQASLDPTAWAGLREFVQRRDRKLQPGDGLRVFLYRNRSSAGRIGSYKGMAFFFVSGKVPPLIASEISWPPLGIVFSPDKHPLLDPMKEITAWGQYGFKDRASFDFSVPNYRIEHHFPLAFGKAAEAEEWINKVGAAYLVTAPDGEDHPTQFSTLVQPVPRGPA